MGSMLGQTPWSMMGELTERNMAMWQEFQRGLSSAATPPAAPEKPRGTAGGKRK